MSDHPHTHPAGPASGGFAPVPPALSQTRRAPINYLNAAYSVRSWLLTLDHKRIGLLYLIGVTFFFFVGGVAATVLRLELMTPGGDVLHSPDAYNRLFTMHGVIMIFFFLVPAIPGVLGNFLLPLMIGARDLAFPRLNLLSWYIYMFGGTAALILLIFGGIDTGWTFYAPFSTTFSNTMVLPAGIAVFITGFSSILTGLNFIVTTHTMRAPGMTWGRLPLFVWAHYATSLIMILGTPVLAIAVLLIGLERLFGIGIFDPALGGDPILFQHLFWFYSHPAVYIMLLPGMAVVNEIVPCFTRRPIFGYKFMAGALLAIAVLGFLVWGHHMFVSGQSMYAGLIFSFLTFFVAVPSAVKVFNWCATMYKGSVRFETPMLYALGFIGLFTIGGVTGLMLGSLGIDVHLHDTYFVVAHFHYIMVGGSIMAFLGGIHFWWPKISGRMYPELWGKLGALVIFVGFNLTFFPQFLLGYLGMPRRYYEYPGEFQVLNVMSTAGASILAVGYIIPLIYFIDSLRKPANAGRNPWRATGLEWQTASPPPTENFAVAPVVTTPPYNYDPAEAEQTPWNPFQPEQEPVHVG
ncbi:MAG: cytochrome c oxidase subunit 1 [Isosphaeraceae bacterium]|jgi:cytochrome c oxidase subunit 1|nr:MAG: cytochrome c oxidase subunit 1 [Isosphaeraceae bacterium]